VAFGDHEGWSAEMGAAVGAAVIPVVTSAGVAVGSCTIPVEISDGLAGVTPVIPVLISDGPAVRPAWVPVGAVCGAPRPVLISDAVVRSVETPARPVLISDAVTCVDAAGVAVPPGSAPSDAGDERGPGAGCGHSCYHRDRGECFPHPVRLNVFIQQTLELAFVERE